MIHPEYTDVVYSKMPRRTDDDVQGLLNIIWPVDTEKYWYPQVRYNNAPGKTKPRVIYIGDSFGWTLIFDGIKETNADAQWWYYCKYVLGEDYDKPAISSDMSTFNWKDYIQKTDCIVLIYTEPQLMKASNDFINLVYDYFYPAK